MSQFVSVPARCKICGCGLTLSIAKDYAAIGDPMRLIALACCNRCGDLREDRIKTIKSIESCVAKLKALGTSDKTKEKRDFQVQALTIILRKFARNVADTERSSLVVPVEEAVETILTDLSKADNVVSHLRQAVISEVKRRRSKQPQFAAHNDP